VAGFLEHEWVIVKSHQMSDERLAADRAARAVRNSVRALKSLGIEDLPPTYGPCVGLRDHKCRLQELLLWVREIVRDGWPPPRKGGAEPAVEPTCTTKADKRRHLDYDALNAALAEYSKNRDPNNRYPSIREAAAALGVATGTVRKLDVRKDLMERRNANRPAPRKSERSILHAVRSETSLNSWKLSVMSEANCPA
jgi:hypothetical protein